MSDAQNEMEDGVWLFVPLHPTSKMIEAGANSINLGYHYNNNESLAKHAFRAMLAAAPAPGALDIPDELDPVFLAAYISEREDWPGREVLVDRIERALALCARAKR